MTTPNEQAGLCARPGCPRLHTKSSKYCPDHYPGIIAPGVYLGAPLPSEHEASRELAQKTTPSKADAELDDVLLRLSLASLTEIKYDILRDLITTTLTQHNEALLAKVEAMKLPAYNGVEPELNQVFDQVTATIKGSTHD